LDREAIFYLQSRGIGLADARNLLIYAFAQDIVDRVKVASLRGQLETLLLEKLHGSRN
jgi:Fe-S cluster assembly protein SufD